MIEFKSSWENQIFSRSKKFKITLKKKKIETLFDI